jgi:bacterioferritin
MNDVSDQSMVERVRRNAREQAEDGAITSSYEGDVRATIELLNTALASEIVCVLRYKFHYVMARGIASDAVKSEFLQHAIEEQDHADRIAKRINQLGGRPEMNPATLTARSATEYREGADLVDMVAEDLVAERIAIQSYQTWIRRLGNHDPTTRRLLEDILAQEEEHANDLHDLLAARDGASFSALVEQALSPSTLRTPGAGTEDDDADIARADGEGMAQPQAPPRARRDRSPR